MAKVHEKVFVKKIAVHLNVRIKLRRLSHINQNLVLIIQGCGHMCIGMYVATNFQEEEFKEKTFCGYHWNISWMESCINVSLRTMNIIYISSNYFWWSPATKQAKTWYYFITEGYALYTTYNFTEYVHIHARIMFNLAFYTVIVFYALASLFSYNFNNQCIHIYT